MAALARTFTSVAISGDTIYAVASDATLWAFNPSAGKWVEMPNLPQPPAAPASTTGGTSGTTTAAPPAST